MKLGDVIKQLRNHHNLTQRDLSNKTGISYSYISTIENNKITPTKSTIIDIAKGLPNANVNELLRLAGYLPETATIKETTQIKSFKTFIQRLHNKMIEKNISIEHLADSCNLPIDEMKHLLYDDKNSIKQTSISLIAIYKIAKKLEITPDYLCGYVEYPDEYSPYMDHPKNLREFLDQEDIIFDDIPLDKNDKDKLKKIIYTIFSD